MAVMRSKLAVVSVEPFEDAERVTFNAVGRPDGYPEGEFDANNTIQLFGPQVLFVMTVVNPDLLGQFRVGQEFFVDFTPAQ